MKKWTIVLLAAAMMLALCGCSGGGDVSGEVRAEHSGGLDAARKAYEALGDEEKLQFYAEITPEYNALLAQKNAALVENLYGEWCTENPLYDEGDSVYAEQIKLSGDMTYEYGRQRGSWYLDEGDGNIRFINEEDGVCYFTFSVVEEGGFVKLLNLEGGNCYVRKEDHQSILEQKYVVADRDNSEEFVGQLQYVGETPRELGFTEVGLFYIMDSPAYDRGLIYVGATESFAMKIEWEMEDGNTVIQTVYTPFELIQAYEGAKALSIKIKSGEAYFIRSEYVEDIFINEYGTRMVLLKNGEAYGSGSSVWEFFPEIPFADFAF